MSKASAGATQNIMTRTAQLGKALAAVALMSMAAGCTDAAGYDLDNLWAKVPFMSDMRTSVSYDPYEMPRLPAEGTIPVSAPGGENPPPFTTVDLVSGNLPTIERPFGPTPEAVERGEEMWLRQCSVCHGTAGEGNGPVVGPGKFPMGPAVTTPIAAGYSDDYLYGIIRVGRGLMPAYGDRITHADRWAIVYYMRSLQQGGAPIATTPPEEGGEGVPVPAADGESTATTDVNIDGA